VQETAAVACQVVLAPLSTERRNAFNETAANAFVDSVLGNEYGYHTLLYTWIDTVADNFPCVAPDFNSTCMTAAWAELFMALTDRAVPEVGWLLYNAAFAKRLGVADTMRFAELLQISAQQGYSDWMDVIVIPESDEWTYNTTRNGEPVEGQDMVCCVFVCNVWKAGGVFDASIEDNFNCAELSNWDDVSGIPCVCAFVRVDQYLTMSVCCVSVCLSLFCL
jgi:hypothetical protein